MLFIIHMIDIIKSNMQLRYISSLEGETKQLLILITIYNYILFISFKCLLFNEYNILCLKLAPRHVLEGSMLFFLLCRMYTTQFPLYCLDVFKRYTIKGASVVCIINIKSSRIPCSFPSRLKRMTLNILLVRCYH